MPRRAAIWSVRRARWRGSNSSGISTGCSISSGVTWSRRPSAVVHSSKLRVSQHRLVAVRSRCLAASPARGSSANSAPQANRLARASGASRRPPRRAGLACEARARAMDLPELHLADWRATKDTLHLYCQILGKIRLATTPPRNHWWNVPLYVDVRGLTTRRLHHRGTTFEIALDFVDDAVVVRTADGRTGTFAVGDGLPVADFDARLHALLADLGVDVAIKEEPFGVPMTTPFPDDVEHASWDHDAIARFWRVLDWSDSVFEEFSGWFTGKTSPVHLFWHSLDL